MLRPAQRRPFAMFANPRRRSAPIARLRSVARIRGAVPVRSWERSSSKVTSRTQWMQFSIFQWPRIIAASSATLASVVFRFVTK